MDNLTYYLLNSAIPERYALPTKGLDPNETLSFSKRLGNRRVPGSPRAFPVGDGKWMAGEVSLSFFVMPGGSDPIADAATLLRTIRTKALSTTSLVREVTTGELLTEGGDTITTEGGDALLTTEGSNRAVLGIKRMRTAQQRGAAGMLRVDLTFKARFGLATVETVEDEADYDAATKTPW